MHESYIKWLKEGQPKIYCYCHCGNEIIIKRDHKFDGIPKYIRGHFNRNKGTKIHKSYSEWVKIGEPKLFCACGCKEEIIIERHHRYYGIPEYIKGHSNRNGKHPMIGKSRTEEEKQKNRIAHLGKHPSEETRQKFRKLNSGKNNNMYGIPPPHGTGHGKGCYYDSPLQGKIWLRSTYELAYAKYLDENKILWKYEWKTFDLGNTTYTPDFYLINEDKFIEVKGYMLPKAQNKINKFLNQYSKNLEILYKEDLVKLGIEL